VHKQLCQQFTRCAERAPAQIAVFVISICEKAMLVYVVSLFLTKIGSIIWSNQLRGPVCDIQGCGVGSPVIRLRLLAISIIRLRLRTDSDLQLY